MYGAPALGPVAPDPFDWRVADTNTHAIKTSRRITNTTISQIEADIEEKRMDEMQSEEELLIVS